MPTKTRQIRLSKRFFALAFLPVFFFGVTACTNTHTPDDARELENPELREQLQGSGGASNTHPGAALYQEHCASCHDSGLARAPARNLLEFLSPESVLASLKTGVMRQQASILSELEKNQVVEYLVGKPNNIEAKLHHCKPGDWFDWTQTPAADGWGIDRENTRFVTPQRGKLTAKDIPRLKPKWVFDYPRSNRARSHPSFAGSGLFVGSQTGAVYALDQNSGCVRWSYQARAEVRTGITIKQWNKDQKSAVGFFSDILARVYAIDLVDGSLLWSTKVDDHHNATTTAQPVLFEDKLFQPISSLEVVPAADPNYACCTFRGAIAVLDAETGEILSKTHTIPNPPKEVAKNNVGTPVLAPSGAPVWNSPTVDVDTRRLYFGTGENYSSPADGNSDAIMAMNIDDGSIAWVTQTTSRDAWNLACMPFIKNKTNCPVEKGPDVDYGAPPILVKKGNKKILVAGQKSGEVFGIRPEDGHIIWRRKIGRGGNQGGMHFGMAADGDTVYVPISDYDDESLSVADARPGIYGVDAFTGELKWSHPAENVCGGKKDCDPGISAAISAVEGAALAGHMDGHLRAYDGNNGTLIWDFDATQTFTSLAGRQAHGGSFGGATAPVAHNGMLYANSGYGIYFHMPGNVLIAFGPD